MLGLSRLLGPFLYPYSRAFPLPHLTIISTILLPDLPFYRPPDSLIHKSLSLQINLQTVHKCFFFTFILSLVPHSVSHDSDSGFAGRFQSSDSANNGKCVSASDPAH